MEELNKTDLSLFFDEEIYIIKDTKIEGTPTAEINTTQQTDNAALPIVEEPSKKIISLNYKGENAKGIAIIVNDDSNEFLNNTDETLLLNILKAIGLSLNDVAIVNHHNSGAEWQEKLEYSKVLVFGILPSTYNIVAKNYAVQPNKGTKWLFSDSLFALGKDKVLKGKLWTNLQELFQ